jgi:hypothetical protein
VREDSIKQIKAQDGKQIAQMFFTVRLLVTKHAGLMYDGVFIVHKSLQGIPEHQY